MPESVHYKDRLSGIKFTFLLFFNKIINDQNCKRKSIVVYNDPNLFQMNTLVERVNFKVNTNV